MIWVFAFIRFIQPFFLFTDTQEDLDFITTAYKEKILHLQDMHKDSLNDIGEVKEKLEEVSNFKAEVDKENEELLSKIRLFAIS